MKYLKSYKLYENLDTENISDDDKIKIIEDNIEEVKLNDKDDIISDTIYSKIKNGLTKTLTIATISALLALTLQSCSGSKNCPNMTWGQARKAYLR